MFKDCEFTSSCTYRTYKLEDPAETTWARLSESWSSVPGSLSSLGPFCSRLVLCPVLIFQQKPLQGSDFSPSPLHPQPLWGHHATIHTLGWLVSWVDYETKGGFGYQLKGNLDWDLGDVYDLSPAWWPVPPRTQLGHNQLAITNNESRSAWQDQGEDPTKYYHCAPEQPYSMTFRHVHYHYLTDLLLKMTQVLTCT